MKVSGKYIVVVILISILILVINNNSGFCEGLLCLEEERVGLLQINASINHPRSGNSLSGWVDDQSINSDDCCNWERVTCDNSTGRVMGLDLSATRAKEWGDWHLNASLFLPFPQLKTIDLSYNLLAGCYKNHGFGDVSPRLKNLEVLDLYGNRLNDTSIFTCISGLSSVKDLNLSLNSLTAALDINKLSNLTKLETLRLDGANLSMNFLPSIGLLFSSLKVLSMSFCHLNGTLPMHGSLCELRRLEELYLRGNKIDGLLPICLGNLSFLRIFDVSSNELRGNIGSLCELTRLEELYLGNNEIDGLLSLCLGNLSFLRILDVSHNQLRGNIAFGPLPNLKSLEKLRLSTNHFEVPSSFDCFMNHSHLTHISFDNNHLLPKLIFQHLFPAFQLKYFYLSNCNSTNLPNFLYTQFDLREVDLSGNNLTGMFPSWLLENNTGLQSLVLRGNSFSGPLQLPNHPIPRLSLLHISNNKILGQIPTNTCFVFPALAILFMADNQLTGSIPPCFANATGFGFLDLSHNFLTGKIPEQFARKKSFVRLSNNNLGGQVSSSFFNSTSLRSLYLDNNNLVGHIPNVSPIRFLLWDLSIGKNHLTGMLPRWIGNMSALRTVDFSGNRFQGSIPTDFCNLNSLQYFDLSENNLTEHIPSCFNLPYIRHIDLHKNQLSGPLTRSLYNCSSLVSLDLSENLLNGPIPGWVGRLLELRFLLLKENQFVGHFPDELCWLTKLSILDLSRNNFWGPISSCLNNFTLATSDKSSSMGIVLSMGESEDIPALMLEEVIKFTTKRMSLPYKGSILNYMSGIDLSCNRFTGEIPPEIGSLSQLRALNLSHNSLTGSIPTIFSGLKQIESLDLSYNNLSGEIPRQLLELHFLAVLSVAHNNLSGKTPDRKDQFGTFDESSYEGNPFLCGLPLQGKCGNERPTSSPEPDDVEDDGWVDMEAFYVTFAVSYTVVVLAIATILCINPYWRRVWFYHIEIWSHNCYYFLLDNFLKPFNRRCV